MRHGEGGGERRCVGKGARRGVRGRQWEKCLGSRVVQGK